ncbi:MAG: cell division protein SepF [Mogibacterium sp.]|nr:cell division protein SepF [Mogibacterium sp.]MBR2540002.1 cell division protein SepF [Mogibacterium sp.]
MSFMDKMKNLVGIDYEDEEFDDITQAEIDEYKNKIGQSAPAAGYREEPAPVSTGISPLAFNEVVPPMTAMSKGAPDIKSSMNQSGPFKMVVIEPKSLDECRKLVDNLRARKPVIINLEKVETDLARKMFDFLGGATYALSGTVQRINPNIYIFAPNNVNIKAMVDRATEAGKPANSNPWK